MPPKKDPAGSAKLLLCYQRDILSRKSRDFGLITAAKRDDRSRSGVLPSWTGQSCIKSALKTWPVPAAGAARAAAPGLLLADIGLALIVL